METESALGVCQEPTSFYLLGVALRSFFLVLATHLLAGEVDTTLAGIPLMHRLSWWCRYYNPLNLSWRYYSMFAYRFTAHSWGTDQLALVNHEEHPFLPPLPYIFGETMSPLHVRRLEMAGLLSSQGILTFSAAYQGALAIEYAISTEGIPYLPNMTVPLAMVGLFRVMASRWIASKIQVDSYPYPCCLASSPASQGFCALCSQQPFVRMSKSNTDPSSTSTSTSSCSIQSSKDPSSTCIPIIKSSKKLSSSSLSIDKSHKNPSLTSSPPLLTYSPITAFNREPSSSLPPISTQSKQPPSSQSHISPLLPTLSRPYSVLASPSHALGLLPSASECLYITEFSPSRTYSAPPSQSCLLPSSFLSWDMSKQSTQAFPSSSSSCIKLSVLAPCSEFMSCACAHAAMPSLTPSVVSVCQVHPHLSTYKQPLDYKSNKLVVAGWIGVLVGLVTMSFLPYKVSAAYQLPHRLLQFSMQLFYQYIAVSEFIFHAYLLFQGPRALAKQSPLFQSLDLQSTDGWILLSPHIYAGDCSY